MSRHEPEKGSNDLSVLKFINLTTLRQQVFKRTSAATKQHEATQSPISSPGAGESKHWRCLGWEPYVLNAQYAKEGDRKEIYFSDR